MEGFLQRVDFFICIIYHLTVLSLFSFLLLLANTSHSYKFFCAISPRMVVIRVAFYFTCRPQGVNSFGSNDAAFASLSPIHHHQSSGGNHQDNSPFASLNPAQKPGGLNPSPNSYSSTGGNPFGQLQLKGFKTPLLINNEAQENIYGWLRIRDL